MINPLTILVYLKKSRTNRDNTYPIYIRITIHGRRTEFSTGKNANLKDWDDKRGKFKPSAINGKLLNTYLIAIVSKITEIALKMESANIPLSIESFMNQYKGKKEVQRMLIAIIQDHNDQMKQLIGLSYAAGTHDRYVTLLKHVSEFIEYQYHIKDIDIKDLNLAFVNDFDFYMRTVRRCANNTTIKYTRNLKKIIRICLDNEWLQQDPFRLYKRKLIAVDRDFLTLDELKRVIALKTEFERLEMVRDIFVFSCFTGLSYSDVVTLTPNNIIKGINGEDWIQINRRKTNVLAQIPMMEIPRQLIEKYSSNPKCINDGTLLPRYSNQLMNNFLKEIAVITNINKNITFHTSRHTFATTVTLSRGVPIETVSKMLGHRSMKTTQVYARITDQKVAEDIAKLKWID